MLRILGWIASSILIWCSCEPPIRVRVTDKSTQRDSVHYVGIAENKSDVDLRKAKLLGTVKVGDRGATLDCRYPDVLDYARRNAGRIGGNLMVIIKHRRNEVKSNCHVIKAEVYHVASLEGMESRMYWHPERRLAIKDLRGSPPPTNTTALPPLYTLLTCWLGGDFFKEAFIRTETLFFPDSAGLPTAPPAAAIALRRAQLHFDLTEIYARRLKVALLAIGPNLEALVGRYRAQTEEYLLQLRQEQARLDAELSSSADPDAVLARWESDVQEHLLALAPYAGHQRVDLRKTKRPKDR